MTTHYDSDFYGWSQEQADLLRARNFNELLMLRSSKILQFTQSLLSCFNEQFGTQCKMIELVLYFQTL